ncbi:MAG: DUF485 domain-containing protein [Bacillota bacterium]
MTSVRDVEQSPEFKKLVTARWMMAIVLTLLVFISYYGFVIMVGVAKPTLAQRVGEVTTLGIPLAVLVIVFSFILTLIYVLWANASYDRMVDSLNKKLES